MKIINNIYLSDDYSISSCNSNSSNNLVIVFGSAGFSFMGTKVEEFFKTLSNLGNKDFEIIWVNNTTTSWFNSTVNDALALFISDLIAKKYEKVFALGESMGGAAALYFSSILPIDIVLSFGPQYSVLKPFIEFNSDLGDMSHIQDKIKIPNYAFEEVSKKSLLIFGGDSWQDFIHACFYKENNFNPYFIKGSKHSVAYFLKQLDLLSPLIDLFISDSYSQLSVDSLLEGFISDRPSNIDF